MLNPDEYPIRILYTDNDLQDMVPEEYDPLSPQEIRRVARQFGKHADGLLSNIWDMLTDEVADVIKEREQE